MLYIYMTKLTMQQVEEKDDAKSGLGLQEGVVTEGS
jgi:hypothetical protein